MKTHLGCPRAPRPPGVALLAVMSLALASPAWAGPAYPAMAPIGQYLMGSAQQEIELARSAAPPSVSDRASIMVLAAHGYVTDKKGDNGFVCLVERSWSHHTKSADFWNPKARAPFCYNPAALPELAWYLTRTRWVLAGASRSEIHDRDRAAWAAGKFKKPVTGAMSYMMSRRGHINDRVGPWRPHLMFYFPRKRSARWGENLPGSPVFSASGRHTTIFFVLVPFWSDGTPAPGHG